MFASLKRLTKHSAVYGIGHILTRSIGFLLLPLYTNYLDPASLGIAAIVFLYLAVMTILYTYGLDSAFLRYYILSDDRQHQQQLFSTSFLTVFATSIIFSILCFYYAPFLAEKFLTVNVKQFLAKSPNPVLLKESLQGATDYFKLSSGILFFDSLAVLPFLVLRAKERSGLFVSLKFLNILVNLGLNLLFIAKLQMGVKGIFLANLISSGFTFLTMLPIMLKNLSLTYSRLELKRLLAFGLPYIPSTMAVVLMDLVDRFILKSIKGYEVLGIYHANYKVAMFMALFVAAFRFAWHPFFLSTSKEPQAKEIFAKVLSYFMLGCAFVYLGISYFVKDLVQLKIGSIHLIGEKYWSGLGLIPIVMLAYIFYGAYLNFLIGIHLEKKTGYLPFITGLGLVINIIGNFALIPAYSMYGAAWATVLSYISMAVALYFIGQKLYPIRYEFLRLIKLAAWVAIYGFLGYFFDLHFAVRILLILSFPFALIISGFFERRELNRMKALIKGFSW